MFYKNDKQILRNKKKLNGLIIDFPFPKKFNGLIIDFPF